MYLHEYLGKRERSTYIHSGGELLFIKVRELFKVPKAKKDKLRKRRQSIMYINNCKTQQPYENNLWTILFCVTFKNKTSNISENGDVAQK